MNLRLALVCSWSIVAACQSRPDEPESRAPIAPSQAETERGKEAMQGTLKNLAAAGSASAGAPAANPTEISDDELAKLVLPPFPGSHKTRFLRQTSWARPGAYTLTVEGEGKLADVASFYTKRVQKTDSSAEPENVSATYVRIRSVPGSATVDVTTSKDGKIVTAQIGYGMF